MHSSSANHGVTAFYLLLYAENVRAAGVTAFGVLQEPFFRASDFEFCGPKPDQALLVRVRSVFGLALRRLRTDDIRPTRYIHIYVHHIHTRYIYKISILLNSTWYSYMCIHEK